MSLLRKRSASHKVHISAQARDNQYIMASFELTDELLQALSQKCHTTQDDYLDLYNYLSKTLFDLTQESDIKNTLFIANDKLPRVRFNQEMHQWQTNQQILFFYNPQYHEMKRAFFDGQHRAKKISMLFLANGEDIRYKAAHFHKKVTRLVTAYCEAISLDASQIRLRDHQHITYDLFAKDKGQFETQTHKLRPIDLRYHQQDIKIPTLDSALTYVVVNLPLTQRLQNQVEIDHDAPDTYNPLYTHIADAFTAAAKRHNLNNGAVIANGLVPIVRNSKNEEISSKGELQMIGCNPMNSQCGVICKWNANELVDAAQLIFIASNEHKSEQGYGRFLNQIEKALQQLSEQLNLSPQQDELIIRFHQHIAYNM